MKSLADISPTIWATLDMERLLNDGSPSGFSTNRPRTGFGHAVGEDAAFDLPAFQVQDGWEAVRVGQSDWWRENNLFPVHPDMAATFSQLVGAPPIASFRGVATSSGRTVYVYGDCPPSFAKLSYHDLVGRVTRHLGPDHLRSAVEVSSLIDSLGSGALHPRFAIYRETGGTALLGDLEGWGYVSREQEPSPHHRASFVVPGFALFSTRFDGSPTTPILEQILASRASELCDPLIFYREFIEPALESYFGVLRHGGLQLEPHAQNLVWLFTSEWKALGTAYRDMESVDKDWPLIEGLGLTDRLTPMQYKTLYRDAYNYTIMHSFMFDFKFGEYLLRPISELWGRYFGQTDGAPVIELIRHRVDKLILDLPKGFFPEDWYDYPSEVHERNDGVRRPYVAHYPPTFRTSVSGE